MTTGIRLRCFHVSDDDPETDMIVFDKHSIGAKRQWANEHGNGPSEISGISARRRPEWDQYAPGPVPALVMIDAGWRFECQGCLRWITSDDIGQPIGHDDDDHDMADEYGPGVSRGIMEPYEPRPGRIWCTRTCHDEDMAERRRIKRMEVAARRIIGAAVLRRWPGVALVEREGSLDAHVYATRHSCGYLLIHSVRVRFQVPGMKHGGCSLHVEDEQWQRGRVEEQGPPLNGSEYHWRSNFYNPGRPRHPLPLSARKRDVELFCANGDRDVWNAWLDAQREEVAA